MYKFINSWSSDYLFEDPQQAKKAGEITQAILAAQSLLISNIAEKLTGKPDANYKAIQRFMAQVDVKRHPPVFVSGRSRIRDG